MFWEATLVRFRLTARKEEYKIFLKSKTVFADGLSEGFRLRRRGKEGKRLNSKWRKKLEKIGGMTYNLMSERKGRKKYNNLFNADNAFGTIFAETTIAKIVPSPTGTALRVKSMLYGQLALLERKRP